MIIIKTINYIILAIIQGLTEPLPISSSGHMKLFEMVFTNKLMTDLNYEVICNFGSFIAILIIFWKDIIKFITDFFNFIFSKENKEKYKKGFWYCIYVVISTIPLVITGLLYEILEFDKKIISPYFLGFAFLITAISLFIVRNNKGKKEDFDITLKDAIIIGLFQAITFMPGISRSGTVLVACLLCKLKPSTALKYTFILYFPVSLGAMALSIPDLISPSIVSMIPTYLIGLAISGVITYLSYEWLSSWVKKGKLIYFSIYCLLLSIFIFIFFR